MPDDRFAGRKVRRDFRRAGNQHQSAGLLHGMVRVSYSKDKSRESKSSFGFLGMVVIMDTDVTAPWSL